MVVADDDHDGVGQQLFGAVECVPAHGLGVAREDLCYRRVRHRDTVAVVVGRLYDVVVVVGDGFGGFYVLRQQFGDV